MARAKLTRERILQAALRLVDESGIEALSMRKLGQELGYEAMSLYNHVANKDAVIDGILDLVLDETEEPPADMPWDEAVRSSALSVHRVLREHPWACELLLTGQRIRPGRLRYMDTLLGRLRDAGFSADTTYHAYHVLDAHIFGFSLWQAGHSGAGMTMEDVEPLLERMVPADVYPHLYEHGRQHFTPGPHQEVSAFELSLDLIVDGLKRMHRR
jgi:AcrR family transcriptional regulator